MQSIWKIRGFFSYIVVVFLNAFTDLGHKIIVQDTIFKVYDSQIQIILTSILNALILLPFVFLFSPSGFLSDRFEKSKVMIISAWFAVGITMMITWAYYLGAFKFAFFLTLTLSIQSAIYSPAKYGYIKELVGNRYLALGNGVVQAVTTVAILSGIFIYSIFFENFLSGVEYANSSDVLKAIAPLGFALVVGSIAELIFAYSLVNTKIKSDITFDFKKYYKLEYLKKNMTLIRSNAVIFHSIIALALFWSISQVILATFPAYAKETLHITNTVVAQGLMALAGIGIIVGSIVSGKVSKEYIETATISLGALGITVSVAFIPILQTPFLQAINFFAFGFFAGLFIVPLNALIQFTAKEHELGVVIAGNNFVQNVSMVLFLFLMVVFSFLGIKAVGIFYFMLIVAFICSVYVIKYIPQSIIFFLISILVSRRFKVEVIGFNNIPQVGGVLLLGNHISWLDWAIIQMSMPRRVRYVMDRAIYEKWYLKLFLDFFKVIPLSPHGAKDASQTVKKLLNDGEVVCIFPEGGISRTGQLSEFKKGFERMAKDSDAVIIPFYLRGMWGSRFSRASSKLRESKNGRKRDIILAFSKPMDINSSASEVKKRVFELSFSSWSRHTQSFPSLQEAWIDTAKRLNNELCMADSIGTTLSYTKVLVSTMLFSAYIKKHKEQNIAILMPTTSAGAILNMSILMAGKTVVNLNYTASLDTIDSAIKKADIQNIYTSRQFLAKLKAKGFDTEKFLGRYKPFYLEDIKKEISKTKVIKTLLSVKLFPATILKSFFINRSNNEAVAAILFSSGSEGEPKGVMLTHRNFMANIKQIADIMNRKDEDMILASLPTFHAFGLTATTFLPMVEGVSVVSHPDPTDSVGIGKTVAKYMVTVMFGTSTFFRLYVKNRKVHPLMFESLRLVVSGAEKLSPDVRESFKQKFHKSILEGYGVTESAPVASVNIPDILETEGFTVQVGHKEGSVGMPLPGTAFKIVDPTTMKELKTGEDGLVLIGGPQVMRGYLKDEKRTAEVLVDIAGQKWYKTGDKGHMDLDGYLYIVDRYSRFTKIGGEMISLGAIESEIRKYLDNSDIDLLAVAVADEKKGEKVVLLISGYKEYETLKKNLIDFGMNPLYLPAQIYNVQSIPKLGTGKNDFSKAKESALKMSG